MKAYFIDKESLKIKDIIKLTDYRLEIDEEVSKKSTLMIAKEVKANTSDFVVIENFKGIITDIINKKGFKVTTITLLDISNLFNRKILLDNEDIILNVGIEDFIKYTIENEFINSSDAFLNIGYITVEVLTHTQINKKVDAKDGIYNFHTYITNAKQNYNINMDFDFIEDGLKVSIYKNTDKLQIVDTTISDVIESDEVITLKYTAKVTVKSEDSGLIRSWYLQSDRTTTEDVNSPTRVEGKIEVVTSKTEEEMHQTALNIFKGNSYNHLIEFKLKKDSKLISDMDVGTPIKIKTSSGIYESYVSGKIIDSKTNTTFYKCGNLRVDLTDKLKKGGI